MIAPSWSIAGASVPADPVPDTGHPDAYSYQTFPNGFVALALAEGSDRVPNGGRGASAIVDGLMAGVVAHVLAGGNASLPEPEVRRWIADVRAALDRPFSPGWTHAATATLAVAGGGLATYVRIGGGSIAVARSGRWTSALPQVAGSPFSYDHGTDDELALVHADEPDAIVSFGIGVATLAATGSDRTPYAPFLDAIIAPFRTQDRDATTPPALATFLASERVSAMCPDARTMVVAARRACRTDRHPHPVA